MWRFVGYCFVLAFAIAQTSITVVHADDQPADSSSAVAALEKWLAADPSTRGELDKAPFAKTLLSKDDAAKAADLLARDHAARIRKERADEMKDRKLKIGNAEMPFWYKSFGDKPATGRSLFISMHGGGGAPKQVNDQQYENQKRLYKPKEGLYLCARAPGNSWDLWHRPEIDKLFDRLIENLVVFEEVDSNRVYLMGYSAGGDGVYQLAPRMADRWAAASMMAGHPNDASPRSLRNVPFTIHVGGQDGAFSRNKVAKDWGDKLDKLRADDPTGYLHDVQVHEKRGHWMNLEDAVAVEWMAKQTRDPFPTKLVWHQDDVTHARSYWLAVPNDMKKGRTEVIAQRDGQAIKIETKDVPKLLVRLNDAMLKLDDEITITANDKQVFKGKAPRTITNISNTLNERGDAKAFYSAEVAIDIALPEKKPDEKKESEKKDAKKKDADKKS